VEEFFMKKNNFRLILLIAGFQLFAFAAFAQNILYTATSDTGSVQQPVDSTIVKSINIRFDNSFLINQNNQTLIITLPEPGRDINVKIVKTRQEINPNFNSFSWYGKLENEPGSFVLLTQVNNAVSGYIRTQTNQLYRINYIGNNLHRISKINQRFYKPDRSDIPSAALLNYDSSKYAESRRLCNDGITARVIDVLVCYTTAARDGAGGTPAITAEILNAVGISNESYSNSLINFRIDLIRPVEIVYTESGNGKTDRDRLQNPTDGFLDNVHNIRQTEAADIVVLLTNDGGPWSAVSYTMETPSPAFESWAFCVLERSAAITNFSFTHELGHIMGAEHDCEFDDGTPISYPYSHGHRSGDFKTIMSKNALGTRVEYWANTTVPFPATTIPSGGLWNNCLENDSQTLINTFDIVSQFRCKNPAPDDSFCSLWSLCFWVALLLSLLVIFILIWFFWRRRRRRNF